mmetsp:Transcript_4731/g.12122  ORF Transcript_4731/g.12122 Transcript_4731/m.12122 type:complete len:214 (+) Transcript_4731:2186-2827(+)
MRVPAVAPVRATDHTMTWSASWSSAACFSTAGSWSTRESRGSATCSTALCRSLNSDPTSWNCSLSKTTTLTLSIARARRPWTAANARCSSIPKRSTTTSRPRPCSGLKLTKSSQSSSHSTVSKSPGCTWDMARIDTRAAEPVCENRKSRSAHTPSAASSATRIIAEFCSCARYKIRDHSSAPSPAGSAQQIATRDCLVTCGCAASNPSRGVHP